MVIKFTITLRKEAPAHLTIHKFLELIKNDSKLLPETQVLLEGLKRAHHRYVPLPLSHEVILYEKRMMSLHKDLNPKKDIYTREDWTEKNIIEYKTNKFEFFNKIRKMYIDMGYEVAETNEVTEEECEKILYKLDKLAEKAKKKIQRLFKK